MTGSLKIRPSEQPAPFQEEQERVEHVARTISTTEALRTFTALRR